MRIFSKSKLIAYRQCPKRLWLELHRPDLRADSMQAQVGFSAGRDVGVIAQSLYDPHPERIVIDSQVDGFDQAFARTANLLRGKAPFFEAGFRAGGALAFADVMLPLGRGTWKMVEVKSSASIQDYHLDDVAIQHFVATQAGVKLKSLALAHVNSKWVYPGAGDYRGLLVETDVTVEAASRAADVKAWIAEAQATASKRREPNIRTGAHCLDPFECGFTDYCTAQEPKAVHPVTWLPKVQTKALKAHLADPAVTELAQVPDALLNPSQQRVKTVSLSGVTHFDRKGATSALKSHKLPAYFLDFESINPAVPLWAGTRPYQQIVFQFSCHRQSRNGTLDHREFLHEGSDDPSDALAAALLTACDAVTSNAPIFVYYASFERSRIEELAARLPRQRKSLLSLAARLVDLLPIVRDHYYHPSQQGKWSIKRVLPALVPDLAYDQLDEVQNGGDAQDAYLEVIAPETSAERKTQRARQLRDYCALDTLAMVRIREALLCGT
jgi:hypothetical protein